MWYVYDKSTTIVQRACRTRAAALAWRTRKHNEFLRGVPYVSDQGPLFAWGCADSAYFHQFIERQVRKTNLMTGAEFTHPANTPRSCDPSSELYWSM